MQLPRRAATPIISGRVDGDVTADPDVSYLDDLAWPITAPASKLAEYLAEAASITAHVFQQYGLTVNFQAGKSEAIAVWRGPGAAQARFEALVANKARLPLQQSGQELRLVLAYKHLGSCISAEKGISTEVQF
eukprot:2741220-Lingulodinium_polyedra.AAC.1